jgi:tetratricopeptide (TPR) repeat protein
MFITGMIVDINKKPYRLNENEFVSVPHEAWNFLDIKENLGHLETIIALINELSTCVPNGLDCISVNTSYGGFVPINISSTIPNVFLVNTNKAHYDNIEHNIGLYNITNILHYTSELHQNKNHIIYSDKSQDISANLINGSYSIVLTSHSSAISSMYKHIYKISNTELLLYVPDNLFDSFLNAFHYYIVDGELNYNNLINLCIMVKNAGPQFENMLQQNLHIFDKWTILDTGSTDSTIEIINKVLVGKKKGALYQEPFINFRDSRNRLLELAGKDCKFIIMIDDTYIIKGNIRSFLHDVRGDQKSDSFTIYIKSDDVSFVSNRIIKSSNNLKYKYKIHEVIQETNNKTYCIPVSEGYIDDGSFDFMVKRTLDRKKLDLKLLEEEINENPNDPRHYYYMAQTYRHIENWEMAANYYEKRINHPVEGFLPEKINAYFELARLFNFNLNKPWVECEELYIKTYQLDNTNQAPYYFIGIHYYLEGNLIKAFEFFQKSFAIGFSTERQFVTISSISYYFLPKFLVELCYTFENFILGEQCAQLFLTNNNSDSDLYPLMISWNNIYAKLNMRDNFLPLEITNAVSKDKPLLCFVADGGFSSWTGSDILSKGVGGSETYIIEMARYIQKHGHFNVIVFCKCVEKSVFENVLYIPIDLFAPFIKQTHVHTCIVSRFSEYVPLAIKGKTQKVYLVLHDLTPSGLIIPLNTKLKKIFCLTEWHVGYFTNIFPQCKDITTHFYYGVDKNKFNSNKDSISMIEKKNKNRFIYSSFPNRGLLELLKMWPSIVEKYADASLDIYADIDGNWVNNVEGAKMIEIRQLLANYKTKFNGLNIYYHGWVNKDTLAGGWRKAEYWFYPCTFMETFCLTALEAALSKTVAITNGLAALQNTVGERGICLQGDATSEQWQQNALRELFAIMEDTDKRTKLIEQNYTWATELTWETQANRLLDEHLIGQP